MTTTATRRPCALAPAITGTVWLVECNDHATHGVHAHFDNYEQADRYLDLHEQYCPASHTVYRATMYTQSANLAGAR